MLKGRDDILRTVRQRFDASLPQVAAATSCGLDASAWPLRISLGRPRADELAREMGAVSTYVVKLRSWQRDMGFDITWAQRMIGGPQEIPTHITVGSAEVAAAMLGREATMRLAAMRARAMTLHDAFPLLGVDDRTTVLRETRAWNDVDFGLLLDAGAWFSAHDARGLTPRQVPLAGFHAKWLNLRGRRRLVAMLANKDELGLVDPPPSVAFAYLDPGYRAHGGKVFDLHVVGDHHALPYQPTVAVIVENKDSYRYFPTVTRGVCIFGAGYAGASHVRELPWLYDVDTLVYWGDMDADGLRILHSYRERGLSVSSMLMDLTSYRRYERYGTSRTAGTKALPAGHRHALPLLTDAEQALYELLCDPNHSGHRRIEQERIPLVDARDALQRLLSDARPQTPCLPVARA